MSTARYFFEDTEFGLPALQAVARFFSLQVQKRVYMLHQGRLGSILTDLHGPEAKAVSRVSLML